MMAKHLFRKQLLFRLTGVLVVAAFAVLTGCSPSIGDACTSSSDCPSGVGAVCDNTITDGYCLVPNCEIGSCPSESVCVIFSQDTHFCMATCEVDGDCRDGLECRMDYNFEGESVGYCYAPAATPQ